MHANARVHTENRARPRTTGDTIMMNQVLAIAIGGAAGALLRFWLSTGMYAMLGRSFPYGTLSVNVLGSLRSVEFSSTWLEFWNRITS